ncbi:MAG: hypothetical protein JXQ73_33715 [Phycisphaerae bacterium]|nr:hypothetical protein [Phycisphaerae bacterium]
MPSPPTIKFIVMLGVIAVSSLVGYVARRRGWVMESVSRKIHMVTMIGGYPIASMLPVWILPLNVEDFWVPTQCILLTLSCFIVGLLVGRLHRLDRPELGVFSYSAAHSNIGFTMGGFICFCLGGEQALAYAIIYIFAWSVLMFAGFFPLAETFTDRGTRLSLRLIARNLFDVRCLSLLGTLVGLALNLAGVPRPEIVDQSHIVDILVIITTAAMFFVIGLTLHVSRIAEAKSLHVSLAVIKFLISPMLALMWIAVAGVVGIRIPGLQREVLIIQSTAPVALFVTVVANLYRLNMRLATAMFVVNTVLFVALVLPVLVFAYGG